MEHGESVVKLYNSNVAWILLWLQGNFLTLYQTFPKFKIPERQSRNFTQNMFSWTQTIIKKICFIIWVQNKYLVLESAEAFYSAVSMGYGV